MGAFGDDVMRFYAADLGATEVVAVTAASSTPSTKLLPGRYLVQLLSQVSGKPSARGWLKAGPFSLTTPPVATAAAPSYPADPDGAYIFELVVRAGYNDQIAAIMTAAAAAHEMYITRIDRKGV